MDGDVVGWAVGITNANQRSAQRWVAGERAPQKAKGRADQLAVAAGKVLGKAWSCEEDLLKAMRAASPEVDAEIDDAQIRAALDGLGNRVRLMIVGRWPEKLQEAQKTVRAVSELIRKQVLAVAYLYPLVPELGTPDGQQYGEHLRALRFAFDDLRPGQNDFVHGFAYDPKQSELHSAFNVVLVFRSVDNPTKVAAFAASSSQTKACYWLGLPQRVAERFCDLAIKGLLPIIDPDWIEDDLRPERKETKEADFETHRRVRKLLRGDTPRWTENLLKDVLKSCSAAAKERGYVTALELGPGDYLSSLHEIYDLIADVADDPCSVSGVDVMPRAGSAAGDANATHYQNSFEQFLAPFEFGSRDLVVALHSLYGMGCNQLARLVAYLRPGGHFIMAMTTRQSFIHELLKSWVDDKPHDLRHRFAEDVVEWFESSILPRDGDRDLRVDRFTTEVSSDDLRDRAEDLASVLLPVEEIPNKRRIADLAGKIREFAATADVHKHETMLLVWRRPRLISRNEHEDGGYADAVSWNDVYPEEHAGDDEPVPNADNGDRSVLQPQPRAARKKNRPSPADSDEPTGEPRV